MMKIINLSEYKPKEVLGNTLYDGYHYLWRITYYGTNFYLYAGGKRSKRLELHILRAMKEL